MNEDGRGNWKNWTRKITDPKWRGPEGAKLAITLKMEQTNRVAFLVTENEFRFYRGKRRVYVCEKEVPGAHGLQTVLLDVADFKDVTEGLALKNWSQLDQLGMAARLQGAVPHGLLKPSPDQAKSAPWSGPAPEFIRLEWK